MINALSVDVEDWFQVSDFEQTIRFVDWDQYEARIVRNTHRILSLLEEYHVRATFFILTWNAERWPELVREIDEAGHEIATHGYAHRLVYTQTQQEFREDLWRSVHNLEDLIGKKVLGYRAPSFSITQDSLWALDVLLDTGLQYDASVFPVRDALYGLPTAQRFPYTIHERNGRVLLEFPMTTVHLFGRTLPLGGGAYLRVLPYRYLAWGMRWVNRHEGQPAVVYIHPWELDPTHPRLPTAGRRGFSTHYLNLHRTEAKLRRLLRDFRFAPVREVLDLS